MRKRILSAFCLLLTICFLASAALATEQPSQIWTCPYCTAVLNDQDGFDHSLESWECQHCHSQIVSSGDELSIFDPETAFEGARYPGIYWYCDNCEAFLNIQDGFDDHENSWKCTECGFENSISTDEIYDSPEEYLSEMGKAYTPDGENYYITPRVYESDSKFAFQAAGEKNGMSFGSYTLGGLRVYGDFDNITSYHTRAAFGITSENFSFAYDYSGELLGDGDENWHLVSNGSKKVDNVKLNHQVGTGCMIIQTSSDGENYTTVDSFGNLFSDYPGGVSDIYTLSNDEGYAGTFFKVIVAYQTQRKIGESNVLFIHNDDFDNRFHVEVYEFYVGYDVPFVCLYSMATKENTIEISPSLYESSKEYHYQDGVTAREMSFGYKSIGSLSLFGQITNTDLSQEHPSIQVADGSIPVMFYDFKDVLSKDDSAWELADDGAKTVGDIKLDGKMGKGAIIYQHSIDNKNWENDIIVRDVFKDFSQENTMFHVFFDDEMASGVYYRVIVAYLTRRKTDTTKVLFVNKDNYEYLKHVEVYNLLITPDKENPSTDIWDESSDSPISGFEIWKYILPYDVTVDGAMVQHDDKIIVNGEHTVTVTTPLGKTESRVIKVENGYEPGSIGDDSDEIGDITLLAGEATIQTHHFDAIRPVNTGKDNGFANANTIQIDDPHAGWTLGHFTISGFSAKEKDDTGDWIFYKVIGDSGEEYDDNIVLQFDLREDIDALHGQNTMKIADDTETFDQGFNYRGNPFRRGTLLIQYEKPDGSIGETQQYANYLDAKESINANTSIEIKEEGDYRIALDYEITSKGALNHPINNNYRIYLSFKVRNGNCTIFAFDQDTGMELENGAITETGFKLSSADSHYLKVFIKREVLSYGVDGYKLNTSFNGFAKVGIPYTEPGLYTISVGIPSTGHHTEKQIFVGSKEEYEDYVAAERNQN